MCIICIDLIKGKLNSKEALRNMGEIVLQLDDAHLKEVLQKIQQKMLEEDKEQNSQQP